MAIVLVATILTRDAEDDPGRAALPGPTDERAPAGLARYYHQEPAWVRCGRYLCTTLRVPLDYAKPRGATIGLSVRMLPAKDGDTDRLLFVNPGGPGGSAVEYVPLFAGLMSSRMREDLAVVGVDPRGVGTSAELECLRPRELDGYLERRPTPDDAAAERAWMQRAPRLSEACRRESGPILDHMSTQESARDLDVARAALGQRRLTYYGASYGTQLGATYADLFGERAGRLVLDGGVDAGLRRRALVQEQTRALQRGLEAFLRWCARRDDCPLSDDAAEAQREIVAIVDAASRKPLASDGDLRAAGEASVLRGMAFALSARRTWPALVVALTRAGFDDGTAFRQLVDAYVQRDADGQYDNNSVPSGVAVRCLDDPTQVGADEVRTTTAPELESVSPVFGRYQAWSSTLCTGWKARGEVQRRVEARGAGPILVVGSTRDPVTPYVWSERLADDLTSAVLVTRRGDGHTSYGQDTCVDRRVDDLLLDGRAPRRDLVCRGGSR